MSMETKRPAGQEPVPGTDSAFEHEDATPSVLVKSGIALAVLLVAVFVAMRFSYKLFVDMSPVGKNASPMEDARILPPRPRLQVDPQMEIHDYCENQARVLDNYGWVDQSAGIVRIPIDRAIALTAAQGLPSRPKGEVPTDLANPASGSLPVPAEGISGQCGFLHNEILKREELKEEVEKEAAEAKEKH